MNGKRVHPALQLGDERLVDHAVALESALPAERLRYDIHAEMRLPALPMTSVPDVLVGFVDDLQARGGESLGQPFGDEVAPCHRLGIAGTGPSGQSAGKHANAIVKA